MILFRIFAFILLSCLLTFSASSMEKADLVVVKKSLRLMTLFANGKTIKTYHIAMGDNPKSHKTKEGDEKTPEGRYILDYKKSDSAFYKAIHISYPNEADILAAKAKGVNPGGYIMIHGQDPESNINPLERQKYNWTNGCIAVTNKEMDELWKAIDSGTPIEIWP